MGSPVSGAGYSDGVSESASQPFLSARSDDLEPLRRLASGRPELQHVLGPLEHFVLVIDTNRVLDEIGWLVAKRRNPIARTSIQELHASGTVSLFAPEHLLAEVEKHLPRVARDYRTTVEAMDTAWKEYRSMIHFIPASHLGEADRGARDPKDVPFIQARDAVGARAIISNDKDIKAMAGLMVAHETIRIAVRYARHVTAAVQGRSIVLGGVVIVGGLAYGAVFGTVALARAYWRLPRWLKVAIPAALLVTAAVVALHPGARKRVREAIDSFKARWPELKANAGVALEQFFSELSAAEADASAALDVVKAHVPAVRKGPALRQLAYRVCLAAGSPIPVGQMVARLKREGYETRAKRPEDYLRRVMRTDPRFRETPTGWDLTARVRVEAVTVLAEAGSHAG
jgi:predicted nucleic acid-binding protein